MKAERQKEPEWGGGSNGKMGRWRRRVSEGQERTQISTKRRIPIRGLGRRPHCWSHPGEDNDLNSSKHLFKHTGVLWMFGLGKDRWGFRSEGDGALWSLLWFPGQDDCPVGYISPPAGETARWIPMDAPLLRGQLVTHLWPEKKGPVHRDWHTNLCLTWLAF